MKALAIPGSPLVRTLSWPLAYGFLHDFTRLRVSGQENVPRHGGAVLTPNHLGPFDPWLLTLAARRYVDWVAMIELYRHPLLAAYCRAMACIPVDRSRQDRASAAECLRRLRGGRLVGIFPERGIRAPGESVLAPGGGGAPLDAGACRLALAARVPIVPALILGSEAMGGFSRHWLFPLKGFEVRVHFGPPLPPDESPDKAGAARLRDRLAAALIDLARAAGA